jgi:lysophospholipase L1-like esterase
MMSKLVTSLVRFILLGVVFVFLFYPERFHVSFSYPGAPQADSLAIRITKTFFWLLVSLEILRVFYYGVVKSKAKGLLANVVTLAIPLVLVLILLEIVFMYVPQSHEGVLSKASQIWWYKYWKPINQLGYRDKEISSDTTKKTVLVIGDSFSAGHGLKSVDERFSDRLEKQLGPGYIVYNLGVSGSDTRDEAKRLRAFPVKPDVIVLQYFPNDIERVGREKNVPLVGAEPYADLHGPLTTLVKHFYLPNFIYWQLPHASFNTFEDFVKKSYTTPDVLNAHLNDLSDIVAYRDSTGARMYTVFIPFLFHLEKSNGYTKPVADWLQQKGVHVVDVTEGIRSIPDKERVVGKNDGHASASVNAAIADRLAQEMKKTNH